MPVPGTPGSAMYVAPSGTPSDTSPLFLNQRAQASTSAFSVTAGTPVVFTRSTTAMSADGDVLHSSVIPLNARFARIEPVTGNALVRSSNSTAAAYAPTAASPSVPAGGMEWFGIVGGVLQVDLSVNGTVAVTWGW